MTASLTMTSDAGIAIGGLVVGLVATQFLTRALAGLLYGVESNDPASLLIAVSILMFTATAACLVPALRATAVDPIVVLKEE